MDNFAWALFGSVGLVVVFFADEVKALLIARAALWEAEAWKIRQCTDEDDEEN